MKIPNNLVSLSLRSYVALSSLLALAFATAAKAQGFDPSATPNNDGAFARIWQNITFGYVVFQACMLAYACIAIYMGGVAIKKHDYAKMSGWWGSGFALLLAPALIKFFQLKAQQSQ